jgi:hypothetical protein
VAAAGSSISYCSYYVILEPSANRPVIPLIHRVLARELSRSLHCGCGSLFLRRMLPSRLALCSKTWPAPRLSTGFKLPPMPTRPANYFHLHLVSDATGETLITVARAATAQYTTVSAIEHIYPLVRSHKQLDRELQGVRDRSRPKPAPNFKGCSAARAPRPICERFRIQRRHAMPVTGARCTGPTFHAEQRPIPGSEKNHYRYLN